jgi:predicted nucleic acid-binding protein
VIVLDASALAELLLGTPTGQTVATRIADPSLGLHVPHLPDVEIVQALRRYAKDGELDAATAAVALETFMPRICNAHEPLLDRVGELRHNLSAYDAVYVALAEVLDTKVLTCDGRLARTPRSSVLCRAGQPPRIMLLCRLTFRTVCQREVRDLPWRKYPTTVIIELYRVRCPQCGVREGNATAEQSALQQRLGGCGGVGATRPPPFHSPKC